MFTRRIFNTLAVSASMISASAFAANIPFERNINLEKEIVANYSEIAAANYRDSLNGALELHKLILNFTKAAAAGESESNLKSLLESAKNTWTKNARVPYGQSEIFRFYNGPIDFEAIDDGVTTFLESINFEGVEGLLNAWPLDEAYIDYVDGDSAAGIINDPSVNITKDQIIILNEQNGEKNISTGYHAIEFLLWGQDRSTTGAGNRPVTDYTTAKNADRRALYLTTLSSTLIDHLSSVNNQWIDNQTNYRANLAKQDPAIAIKNMFVSMISMAGDELKSERIENALILEDQEEEHSCFSDTTINDILGNYLGVKNIYLGTYQAYNAGETNVVGKGVSELVKEYYPALDQQIKDQMLIVEEAIAYFYGSNAKNLDFGKQDIKIAFDTAITSQQDKVQDVVNALDQLDHLLKQAADDLGYQL